MLNHAVLSVLLEYIHQGHLHQCPCHWLDRHTQHSKAVATKISRTRPNRLIDWPDRADQRPKQSWLNPILVTGSKPHYAGENLVVSQARGPRCFMKLIEQIAHPESISGDGDKKACDKQSVNQRSHGNHTAAYHEMSSQYQMKVFWINVSTKLRSSLLHSARRFIAGCQIPMDEEEWCWRSTDVCVPINLGAWIKDHADFVLCGGGRRLRPSTRCWTRSWKDISLSMFGAAQSDAVVVAW